MRVIAVRFFQAVLLVAFAIGTQGQVIISEFMAANAKALADQDGEYSDWIELFNSSSDIVSLGGWSLTDNPNQPAKWRFPSVNIGPRGFLVVFASGKDRAVAGAELHANFGLNRSGEYLALVRPDGTIASAFSPSFPEQFDDISYGSGQDTQLNRLVAPGATARVLVPSSGSLGVSWIDPAFNDSNWTQGTTGIGYESSVPGFAIRNVKAAEPVSSLGQAESVLADANLQTRVVTANSSVINFFGTGGDGHFNNNLPFPGSTIGQDIDDFVVEATGTITIPSAGEWTFGVSSDDGFLLRVGAFEVSYPAPRAPGDTFGTFNFAAPGDYPLRLLFYERGGGAEVELFAMKGRADGWDSTFRLVGDESNGGLGIRSTPLASGIATGGPSSYRSLISTDLLGQMHQKNASAYIRIPFTAPSTALESLVLRIQYDDGFIAYLNGQEVARRNAPSTAQWDSNATSSRPANEALSVEEIHLSQFIGALRTGDNLLAIHGLNSSRADSDFLIVPEMVEYRITALTNHYFSTSTPGSPNGTGFFAFVGDTKFSHDRGFYDAPFDLTISTVTPGASIRFTTNGLPPTEATGLLYTGPIRISGTTVLRARAFKSGFEPSNADTQTYFFLDDVIRQSPTGAPPPGWPSSWGNNVRDYGMDPDIVNHPTYRDTIKNDLKTIPSFSIVMNLNDLFHPTTGIYANANQDGRDWERPASVELIHPDGTDGFQIDAGIRIRGGFSRSSGNPKHAFRLFFRKEYGAGKLRYPLFGDQGTDTFDAIDLRTFQNYSWSFQGDSRGIFVRDQFSRDTQLAMGHQAERGNFYHLYINGQYWGLFNTCERPEASYAATYYGGNKEDYDVIKVEAGPYTINATDGTMAAWTRMYNLAKAGLASDAAYQRIQGNNPDGTPNPSYENLVDVPNLIDYMLVIIYGGNLDAPISNFLGNTRPNNWYGIRNRNGPHGFRFFAHDAEHTLLNVNEDRTGPYPAGDSSVTYSNPQWIMKQMSANAEFKMLFADHVHRHFFNGGVLTPDSARQRLLARRSEIDRAVVGESARWGDAKRSTPFTRTDWLNAYNGVLQNYIPNRSAIVLNQLRADGLYPSVAAPAFRQHGGPVERGFNLTMSAPAGTIYYTLDGSDPRLRGGGVSPSARIYRTGSNIALSESTHVKSRAISGTTWSALNEATFTVIQTFKDLLITEIMYNPPDQADIDGDEFEFIELKNVAATALDLSGVHFTNGITFKFPNGTTLAPGQFAVLASNAERFQTKYPGVPIAGVYTGRLSNGGERVSLVHAVGTPIFSVSYDDETPWPNTPDGAGFSLVPINPNLNPDPDNASNWRASSKPSGSPGADDPSSTVDPVWITEILTHTDPPERDSIELHNPGRRPVDVGHWFLTDERSNPKKFGIPPGTIIPIGGYLVLTDNQFNASPGSPGSFNLSSHGESVYLFSADASGNLTGFSDGFSFGAAANGVSFGRYTTSNGEIHYPPQVAKTFGASNAGPSVGPIVINEVQYSPATGDSEYIELKNFSSEPVQLFHPQYPTNTWRVNGIGFEFPQNMVVPANGLVLLVATDPAAFRTRHSVPADVPVLGPFAGALQDNGELLQVQRPDAPDIGTSGVVVVPYLEVDSVRYNDKAPWPTNAAGLGPSLERIHAARYGNDPSNWRASPGPASPGFENTGNRLPQVNAGIDISVQTASFPFVTNLVGTVIDDGLPNPPAKVSVRWEQVDGPFPATFTSPAEAATPVSFPIAGTYVLRLTANDGEHASSAEINVRIENVPVRSILTARGDTWKYLDNGSNQGVAWRVPAFNDSTWPSGKAQLGYGDGDEATVIGFGPNRGNKYRTSYFRRAFNVSNASSIRDLTVRLLRDDGAIVYLNGTEIFRSNMPEGDVTYVTFASNVVGGAEESTFFEKPVDPALLVDGRNVLAVELHQVNASSSDQSFDLELAATSVPSNQPPVVDAGPDQTIGAGDTVTLTAQAADDGLPQSPATLSVAWSRVSGPGTVSFGNPNAAATTASFSTTGVYVLRFTASDGALSANDEITVTVTGTSTYQTWRATHFTSAELANPNISGEQADPDGDAHSNREEFVAGTDPRNAASVLKFASYERIGGSLRLRLSTVAGKSYSVQYSDSPLPTGNWQTLTNIAASAEFIDVTDPNAGTLPRRFYRVVVGQ